MFYHLIRPFYERLFAPWYKRPWRKFAANQAGTFSNENGIQKMVIPYKNWYLTFDRFDQKIIHRKGQTTFTRIHVQVNVSEDFKLRIADRSFQEDNTTMLGGGFISTGDIKFDTCHLIEGVNAKAVNKILKDGMLRDSISAVYQMDFRAWNPHGPKMNEDGSFPRQLVYICEGYLMNKRELFKAAKLVGLFLERLKALDLVHS